MASASAPPTFDGFPPETFGWFAGKDNSKAYFTAYRSTYDGAVRGALQAMLDEELIHPAYHAYLEVTASDDVRQESFAFRSLSNDPAVRCVRSASWSARPEPAVAGPRCLGLTRKAGSD
jgi:hypothetical protein